MCLGYTGGILTLGKIFTSQRKSQRYRYIQYSGFLTFCVTFSIISLLFSTLTFVDLTDIFIIINFDFC